MKQIKFKNGDTAATKTSNDVWFSNLDAFTHQGHTNQELFELLWAHENLRYLNNRFENEELLGDFAQRQKTANEINDLRRKAIDYIKSLTNETDGIK